MAQATSKNRLRTMMTHLDVLWDAAEKLESAGEMTALRLKAFSERFLNATRALYLLDKDKVPLQLERLRRLNPNFLPSPPGLLCIYILGPSVGWDFMPRNGWPTRPGLRDVLLRQGANRLDALAKPRTDIDVWKLCCMGVDDSGNRGGSKVTSPEPLEKMNVGIFVTSLAPKGASQARFQRAVFDGLQRLGASRYRFIVFTFEISADLTDERDFEFVLIEQQDRKTQALLRWKRRAASMLAFALRLIGLGNSRIRAFLGKWMISDPRYFKPIAEQEYSHIVEFESARAADRLAVHQNYLGHQSSHPSCVP